MGSLKRKKKKTEEIVAVLDIGSATVSGALTIIKKGAVPRVLYEVQRPIPAQSHLDTSRLVDSMLTALKLVVTDITQKGTKHMKFTKIGSRKIEEIFCVLSSPWYTSQTRTVNINKETPFVVTNEVFEKMLNLENEHFEDSALSKKDRSKHQNVSVIERKIVNTKLNGYRVVNPIGKSTKSITASLFVSTVSNTLADKIETVLSKVLHVKKLTYSSFPLASMAVLHSISESTKDYIFIDVTGEVTDVMIVKNNIPISISSFPKGKHYIMRHVARSLNTINQEVVSLVKILNDEKEDAKSLTKTKEVLLKLQEDWNKSLADALEKMGGGINLPSKVFLVANNDFGKLFKKFIEGNDYIKNELTTYDFDVILLNGNTFKGHLRSPKKVVTKDSFLAIDTIFTNMSIAHHK